MLSDPSSHRGSFARKLKTNGGSSTGFTVLHLRHLGEHGLTFLMEFFNISAAGVDIPAIWKNSIIIPILKARKPRDQGRSYHPHLSALLGSKDTGVAPPPVHRGATGYSPFPARLQTEALHRLGPAPYFC